MASEAKAPLDERRLVEEYRRRYEDQTLRAMESHSNTFGQALLAAYLLFPAEILLDKAENKELYQLPLMLALYVYMTYTMKVLGSLVKDVTRNAERLHRLHAGTSAAAAGDLKLIHLYSSRIKLASPLGPLQWASIVTARKVAMTMNHWSFWLWVIAGLTVLLLMLGFLLFPLAGVLRKCPVWIHLAALGAPAYYGARLCFRFPRYLVGLIRSNIRANAGGLRLRERFMKVYSWLSEWFDQGEEEKPQ
jgi:hypothetical protein